MLVASQAWGMLFSRHGAIGAFITTVKSRSVALAVARKRAANGRFPCDRTAPPELPMEPARVGAHALHALLPLGPDQPDAQQRNHGRGGRPCRPPPACACGISPHGLEQRLHRRIPLGGIHAQAAQDHPAQPSGNARLRRR